MLSLYGGQAMSKVLILVEIPCTIMYPHFADEGIKTIKG